MSDSADEMKSRLNTKSGFRKFLRAREYHKAAEGVYRHVKVAFARDLSYHTRILLFPPQFVSDRVFDQFQSQSQPTSSEAGRFRVALTVYGDLTLCMDQRISIEPPGPYTDPGLAARIHSHRLLRRKNGRWMR